MTQDLGFSKGLADVIADATSVSQVQGEEGKLFTFCSAAACPTLLSLSAPSAS